MRLQQASYLLSPDGLHWGEWLRGTERASKRERAGVSNGLFLFSLSSPLAHINLVGHVTQQLPLLVSLLRGLPQSMLSQFKFQWLFFPPSLSLATCLLMNARSHFKNSNKKLGKVARQGAKEESCTWVRTLNTQHMLSFTRTKSPKCNQHGSDFQPSYFCQSIGLHRASGQEKEKITMISGLTNYCNAPVK